MCETRAIILASASPRRKELLELIGLQFKVDTGDYKEDMSLKLSSHELARFLSLEKAKSIAGKYNNAIIIAADTFVVIGGQIPAKRYQGLWGQK